jgi:hypothetical protein
MWCNIFCVLFVVSTIQSRSWDLDAWASVKYSVDSFRYIASEQYVGSNSIFFLKKKKTDDIVDIYLANEK